MEPSDFAARLDAWTARARGAPADAPAGAPADAPAEAPRAAGGSPPPRPGGLGPVPRAPARGRPSRRRRPPASRPRAIAAGLLVAGLGAAWLGLRTMEPSPASQAPRPVEGTSAPAPADAPADAPGGVPRLRALRAAAGRCDELPGDVPALRCEIGGVRLDARFVGRGAGREYVAAAGARVAPRTGPPACARGSEDERAWSRPGAPARAVGRYRCRIEGGRAAMWWSDEHGFVLHAVAPHGDLARLFAWWRAHEEV